MNAPQPISEILVPVDFSDCSGRALEFAMRLAVSSNARLHLLAVVDDAFLMDTSTDQSFRDQESKKVEAKLDEVIAAEMRETFQIESVVRFGTAYHEIEVYAGQNSIDLVVMGNVGRGAIADVLLGSVAKHVVRHAPCPVTTVTHVPGE